MPEWPDRGGSFRLSFSVFRGQPSLPAPPPQLATGGGRLGEGHGGGCSRVVRGWNGSDGMSAAENYKSASFQEDKALCRRASGVLEEAQAIPSWREGAGGQGEIELCTQQRLSGEEESQVL